MTSGGDGRFGAPRQSVVNTCSSVRASRELHGTVPLSRLLSIVATSRSSNAPICVGIVPVKKLFSIWKKLILASSMICVLIVPVSSLSFRSSCRRLDRSYSSSGIDPWSRLKLRSICSSERISPSSVGIVPVNMPSSSTRFRRFWSRLSSWAIVPPTPFCSNSSRTTKPSSLHPIPPHPHSFPDVNHASLPDSKPLTMMVHRLLASASAPAGSTESTSGGGAEHWVHRSPRVLK
mmetsp:Transcript_13613/g.38299  ORF Transcript_13613/g.38299 Transcript_13613/m.38299 type:complete len:234 (-) Transcript_13613:2034-2735(-)